MSRIVISAIMSILLALPSWAAEDNTEQPAPQAAIPQVCHDAAGHEDAAKGVQLWTECLGNNLDDRIKGIALYNRGRRQVELEKYEEAIEDYTEAAQFMRTDADVYINRGHAHMQLDNFKDAHSDFSRAIAMNPQDADAYANRGAVNIRLDAAEEAVYDLEKAIKNDPAHLAALRGLATILGMDTNEEIRDGRRAVEVALRLVNLERTWETLEILAAAHAEAEQFPQAVEAQKKALELARAEGAGTGLLEDNLDRYERERKYK